MKFWAFWVLGQETSSFHLDLKEWVFWLQARFEEPLKENFSQRPWNNMYLFEFEEVFLSTCSNLLCTIMCLTPSLLVNDSLHPIMKLSAVTSELVHLWSDPNRCFWSFSHLLQSFAAPLPLCLKRVAGIQFRMHRYLKKINDIHRVKH